MAKASEIMPLENPLKWLLAALPECVPPDRLADLMERYEMNKRAYYHAVKVRDLERKIKIYTRRNDPRDAVVLEKWQARLATLKEESSE